MSGLPVRVSMRALRYGVVLLAATPLFGQAVDLAVKSQRGKEAMAAGKFAEAASIYAELVKALPGNPGLLVNLGMAEHMAGRPRQAIPQFQAALRLDAGLFPAWLFLGVAHLDAGEPARAIEPLEKALRIQPDYPDAHQALASALFSLGRFREAAEPYQRLAQMNPKNSRAWYGLGKCYESLSRRAFADLERIAPASGYWLALAAGMRLAQQQYSGAFFLYRQALEKQPGLRGLHPAVADIYRRTGHADWAAVEEQKERRLPPLDCASRPLECDFFQGRHSKVLAVGNPQTPEAYYWQSLAYNELALQAFERLAQLPPSAEWHQVLAEAHRNMGRHLEAVKEWREALRLSPGNLDIPRELAISLHQGRDYKAAQASLEDLLKRDPTSAELNYYLGDALLNLQQAAQAAPFLRKAVERDAAVIPAQASLGRAYLLSGQAAQAIPHLKAALPIDDDGSLHYQLARAYQSAGQSDLAKETLQKYQEIRSSAQGERNKLEQDVRITGPE